MMSCTITLAITGTWHDYKSTGIGIACAWKCFWYICVLRKDVICRKIHNIFQHMKKISFQRNTQTVTSFILLFLHILQNIFTYCKTISSKLCATLCKFACNNLLSVMTQCTAKETVSIYATHMRDTDTAGWQRRGEGNSPVSDVLP
jgi:hypothetical protein